MILEVSRMIVDAYEVRSKIVHGGLLKIKKKEELSEKYGNMNNLIEKILDSKISNHCSITVKISKDELVSTIDKSLDSKIQDKLKGLTNPTKNI